MNNINNKNIYLDINSKNRNRNDWSNPSEFEVINAPSSRNNVIDPVSEYSAEKVWLANNFHADDDNKPSIVLATINPSATMNTRIGYSTSPAVVYVSGTGGQLQNIDEYYTGCIAVSSASANDKNIITSYKYLGDDRAQLTFASSFTTVIIPGTTTLTINDPTDIGLISSDNANFFVPTGALGSNSYPGYYLFNENRASRESRLIKSYDDKTKILILDTQGAADQSTSKGPIFGGTDWKIDSSLNPDVYSIRKKIPQVLSNIQQAVPVGTLESSRSFNLGSSWSSSFDYTNGFLERPYQIKLGLSTSGPSSTTDNTNDTLPITLTNYQTDTLKGCFIRINTGGSPIGEVRKIKSNTNAKVIMEIGFTSSVGAVSSVTIVCPNETKRIIKSVNLTSTLASGSSNSVINFNITDRKISNENGYYKNLYIDIGSETALIADYTVAKDNKGVITKKSVTLNSTLGLIPLSGVSFTINSLLTENDSEKSNFHLHTATTTNGTGTDYYILPYKEDNFKPIPNFSFLKNENIYEIELMSLILPNKIVNTGHGDSIRFYPYIYVGFSNKDSSMSNNNIISNSIQDENILFKVAIFDVSSPSCSSFLKIDGNHMIQRVSFKPYNNLKFSIYLPNGELVKFLGEENFGPYYPNNSIQVSALFCLNKLDKDLHEC
jgi:hypothetical protein